jgi:hypothetical protein
VGRIPSSARGALVPPVGEESVESDHRGADQGVGRGRGRPPPFVQLRKRDNYVAFGRSAWATLAGKAQRGFAASFRLSAFSCQLLELAVGS